mgnify:CR=1 FL=1
MDAHTTFQTEHGKRYLGTLCKHFGHKIPVQLDGDTGRIDFSFGHCKLKADDTSLVLNVSAGNQANLDKAVQVITSHLERFAFRENPQLNWQPTPGAD